MTWWTYLLLTNTGSFYCGISKDVKARVATHNRGKGSKYLRGSRLPAVLLISWCFEGEDAHGDALRAELWIKNQTRHFKAQLATMEARLDSPGWAFAAREGFSNNVDQILRSVQ